MKIEPTLKSMLLEDDTDPVNKPSHYTQIKAWVEGAWRKIEAINIIRALCKRLPGGEAALYFNVMKYMWRYPDKNGLEDLLKADNYLQLLIEEHKETHK